MAQRKRGNKWSVYYRDENGKIRTQSTGTGDKTEAKAFERKILYVVKQRRMDKKLVQFLNREDIESRIEANASAASNAVQKHVRGSIRLDAMFDEALKNRKLSDQYRMFWSHFAENCGKTYADEVTPQVAFDYLVSNYGNKSAKTYNNHKGCLNTIFRLCLVQAKLNASPFVSIADRAVTDVEHHRNLTDSEIEKIMSSTNDQCIRTMTMLSRWTGQRMQECALMAWNDFDFERRVFLVEPGKTKRFKKFVCIPLFDPLAEYILSIEDKIKNMDEPIAVQFGFKNSDQFSKLFLRHLERIGITSDVTGSATFHSLRGSFITWSKDAGIPADVRRAITGHSSLSTEDIYARSIQLVSDVAKMSMGKN